MITLSQLKQFAPGIADKDLPRLHAALVATMERFEINTLRRCRYFMSQSFHETRGYVSWVEGLNYTTPARIVTMWGKRFHTFNAAGAKLGSGPLLADDYIRNPEKLALAVYSDRMGNGPAATREGFLYIGRGAFHLTGKFNYTQASNALYGDNRFVSNPELVAAYEDGLLTAGWFWHTNGLGQLADKDAFTECTKRIQGSTDTVAERLPVLRRANQIFVGV